MVHSIEATRRIRVNTVKFDVECVFLYYRDSGNFILCGGAFRKADIKDYLLPHQMEVLTGLSTEKIQYNYLTVIPYGETYLPTLGMEVDPNLTDAKDINLELSPDSRIYRHHTRTLPYSEMCFDVPVGGNLSTIVASSFFSVPTANSVAYNWFSLTNAPEEMIVIPLPDINGGAVDYYSGVEYKTNLGYAMPDCAMRDAIYSNYQVLRGNEYGTREHIIDPVLPTP